MTWIVDDWQSALARDGRVALMPSRFQAQVCLGLAGLLAGLGVWAGSAAAGPTGCRSS